jgi:glycosyltransferase involved in cell wall biosynthesis
MAKAFTDRAGSSLERLSTRESLVSVVMPVFNAERFLAEAIESVRAQSYPHWELVLVDDGSSDGSCRIAQEFAARDARIRAFRNERNLGIVRSRNRAFAEADSRSEYFAILDADDVCMPDRLARQVAFLDTHPDHAVLGGNTLIIDETGAVVGERIYPASHEQIVREIGRHNPIANPTAMVRRSAIAEVGEFDERYPRCQDYDLWLRMAARYKIANLDHFTLKYRISASQGKTRQLRESLRFTIAIQRRWLFHPPFFSAFNLIYFGLEHGLLLLPDALILRLFKSLTYKVGSQGG